MATVRYYEGVGRRKTSTARVRLYPGTGSIVVNDRALEDYFPRETDRIKLLRPLNVAEAQAQYNVSVHVAGGGTTGQTGAVIMGVARALVEADETLKTVLRKNGFLTRDARAVERKKPGLTKARRAKQYTKR